MQNLKTGVFAHPAIAVVGRLGRVAMCVLAALVGIAGTAHATVPKGGAWQSTTSGWDQPRVSFDVVRPAGKWNVLRLSFPDVCDASTHPRGWVSTTFIRAQRGGRFVASGLNAVIRGRFVTTKRAVVTVRP